MHASLPTSARPQEQTLCQVNSAKIAGGGGNAPHSANHVANHGVHNVPDLARQQPPLTRHPALPPPPTDHARALQEHLWKSDSSTCRVQATLLGTQRRQRAIPSVCDAGCDSSAQQHLIRPFAPCAGRLRLLPAGGTTRRPRRRPDPHLRRLSPQALQACPRALHMGRGSMAPFMPETWWPRALAPRPA